MTGETTVLHFSQADMLAVEKAREDAYKNLASKYLESKGLDPTKYVGMLYQDLDTTYDEDDNPVSVQVTGVGISLKKATEEEIAVVNLFNNRV